jgi:hypothetical protein
MNTEVQLNFSSHHDQSSVTVTVNKPSQRPGERASQPQASGIILSFVEIHT